MRSSLIRHQIKEKICYSTKATEDKSHWIQ
uniref:Uncharacterized protein n=1 Tax=Arundo donax TaxID=35708 RepID=A0A0A9FX90_ARUDO